MDTDLVLVIYAAGIVVAFGGGFTYRTSWVGAALCGLVGLASGTLFASFLIEEQEPWSLILQDYVTLLTPALFAHGIGALGGYFILRGHEVEDDLP